MTSVQLDTLRVHNARIDVGQGSTMRLSPIKSVFGEIESNSSLFLHTTPRSVEIYGDGQITTVTDVDESESETDDVGTPSVELN